MSRRRVMFYVQHLLGIGHLRRTAVLAKACAGRGLNVTVVSGGVPVEGLDLGDAKLIQLPALRATDETFATLVDGDGQPLTKAWRDTRCAKLLAIFARLKPHVLVIEMFPFGRRQLRNELLPLLDAAIGASHGPSIVSSVRDVINERAKRRTAEAANWVRRYFDAVLVHGDPAAIRFENSFPAAEKIADRVVYTGYVAGPPVPRGKEGSPGWNEVVVSAGGGAFGEALMWTALEARPYSRSTATLTWRLLAGANLPKDAFSTLAEAAPEGVIVEPARPDFPQLLANCAVSVSQCGYNTAVDILRARARAVVVPFARGGQTEQAQRADALGRLGLVSCLAEDALTPARLVATIDSALAGPRPRPAAVSLDGADRSATVIADWADRSGG